MPPQKLLIYHPPMSGWARAAPLGYENLWTAAGFSGTDAAIVETAKLLAEAGVAEVTVADYLGTDAFDKRAYAVDNVGGGTRYLPADALDVSSFDWYCPLFFTYEARHDAFLAAIRDKQRTKILLWAHCPLVNAHILQMREAGFHVVVVTPSEWLRRHCVAALCGGDEYLPPPTPVRVVPNGVAPRFFAPPLAAEAGERRRRRRRCCSPTTPKTRGAWYFPACFARGGAVAVRAFQRVRAARPAAASALHMLSYYLPDKFDDHGGSDAEGCDGGVRRHGSLPRARVAEFAAASEYLVYPLAYAGTGAPHHETFGCSILEALAAGAIVVTWAVGCIPSLYGDRVVALPPPPGYAADALHGSAEPWFLSDAAVDALAEAVLALDADPARRAALRSRGMAWARKQTWARSAAALRAVLLEEDEKQDEKREDQEEDAVPDAAVPDVPTFTTDWFSGNIPAISQSLAQLCPAAQVHRILEIGSWEGRSTLWFLEHCPCATVACVDTFEGGDEHQGSASLVGLEARFRNNVAKYADRVIVHRGVSGDALFGVGAPGSFDVAYVDGSHTSWDALTDIVLSFQLLRPGGLMLIDDYGGGDPGNLLPTSPRPAVDAFLHIMQSKISVLHFGYQVHLQKK